MSNFEPGKFKAGACLTIFLSLFVALPTPAQERQRAKVKAAPLEIKLSTPTPVICAGTSLLLEMEIKNVSRKEVKIDKFHVWNQFSYSTTKPDGSATGGVRNSGCSHCLGDFIFFHPGMTYWDSYNFVLKDDFFQGEVEYTLGVSINSVYSNEVKFKLIDCGMKPTEVTK